jgi:hypothetical protein
MQRSYEVAAAHESRQRNHCLDIELSDSFRPQQIPTLRQLAAHRRNCSRVVPPSDLNRGGVTPPARPPRCAAEGDYPSAVATQWTRGARSDSFGGPVAGPMWRP